MPRELSRALGFWISRFLASPTALAAVAGLSHRFRRRRTLALKSPIRFENWTTVEAVLAIGRRSVPLSQGAPAGLSVSTART